MKFTVLRFIDITTALVGAAVGLTVDSSALAAAPFVDATPGHETSTSTAGSNCLFAGSAGIFIELLPAEGIITDPYCTRIEIYHRSDFVFDKLSNMVNDFAKTPTDLEVDECSSVETINGVAIIYAIDNIGVIIKSADTSYDYADGVTIWTIGGGSRIFPEPVQSFMYDDSSYDKGDELADKKDEDDAPVGPSIGPVIPAPVATDGSNASAGPTDTKSDNNLKTILTTDQTLVNITSSMADIAKADATTIFIAVPTADIEADIEAEEYGANHGTATGVDAPLNPPKNGTPNATATTTITFDDFLTNATEGVNEAITKTITFLVDTAAAALDKAAKIGNVTAVKEAIVSTIDESESDVKAFDRCIAEGLDTFKADHPQLVDGFVITAVLSLSCLFFLALFFYMLYFFM